MARVTAAVLVAVLAGCYSPHISECSITCGAAGACPSDTTCMADGYCHADIAVSCFPIGNDGGGDKPDARVGPDAPRPVDARPGEPDAKPGPPDGRPNEPDARVPDAGFPCTNVVGFIEKGDAEDSLISNLSVEKSGNLHVTYYDAIRGMIRYAHRLPTTDWQFEDVAPATDNLRGQTIDPTGTLHIVFSDDVLLRPRLRYGRRLTTGPIGGWKFDTVEETAVDIDPTIAIDNGGGIHIAYWYNLSDLVYARRTGGATTFTNSPVDTEGTVGEHASIAISPTTGTVNVSYRIAGTRLDLGLATLRPDQSNWNLTRPDQAGNVGAYTAIAVDAAGGVHIAYADDTNTQLKYAYLPAQGPSLVIPVENALGVGHFNSIAVDGNGNVHISYYAYFEQNLRYAVKRAGQETFSARNIDTSGNVGRHSSIGVDGQNTVHISYIDDSNGDVKYAHICP